MKNLRRWLTDVVVGLYLKTALETAGVVLFAVALISVEILALVICYCLAPLIYLWSGWKGARTGQWEE